MALNINKKTGDEFTAAELNQIVAEINKKADSVPGKSLSTNDYTDEEKQAVAKITDKVDKVDGKSLSTNDYTTEEKSKLSKLVTTGMGDRFLSDNGTYRAISASSSVTSDEELTCGKLRVAGVDHEIYRRVIQLTDLPQTAGEVKNYTICNDPLGESLYLSADNLIVRNTITDEYLPEAYAVEKIYIDSDCNTILVLECRKAQNTPNLSAMVRMEYIKSEKVSVELSLPQSTGTEDISIQIPPLKYAKKFAYSYTFDDTVVQAYGKAFCTINKRWVDNEKFYHVGQARTTGAVPEKTLGYTDGLGVEKRFAFGVAIWPTLGNAATDNFMEPTGKNPDKYYPYLLWQDVAPLLDFGNSIYFHNVDERMFDKTNPTSIADGLRQAQSITHTKTGRRMKNLARPDGNNAYIDAANDYSDIVFMQTESSAMNVEFAPDDVNLTSKSQQRRYTEPIADADQLMESISAAAGSTSCRWLHDFSHAPANFQYIIDLFGRINDLYGKDGDDSVWFASVDEIYEYWFIRKFCRIKKVVDGDKLIVNLYLPKIQNGYYKDFTLLISGVSDPASVTVNGGDEVFGVNCGAFGDGLLVNVDCNDRLMERAERYTALFEKSAEVSDKSDALYFINQLKPTLREPLLARVNGEVTPPTPQDKYTVTASSNNTSWGTVAPDSMIVDKGGAATFTATPKSGYTVEGWSGTDSVSATLKSTVSNVQSDRVVRCNFKVRELPTEGSKTVISFNTVLAESGINALNLNTATVPLKDVNSKVVITYIRPDNRPATGTVYEAVEATGAPYSYEVYRVAAAAYGNAGEANKKALTFSAPAGVYKISLYCNTKNGNIGDSPTRIYSVNGVRQTPSFEVIGNSSNVLVFENVTPMDGVINIEMWAEKNWVAVPVNVIEIEKL